VRRSLTTAIAISGLVLLITAALAYLFSRRLAGTADALAERAAALGEGRSLPPLTSGIKEFGLIDRAMADAAVAVAERAQLTERLAQAVAQKDVLLKEVNHRVKNSLQLVASLLNLQRNQIGDKQTRHHFEDAARRISVVAQVHQRLYQDDRPDQVAFDGFINELCRDLDKVFPERRIRIECDAEPFFISNDKVVPIALVLNELIANAFKYSFPDNADGLIRVTARRHERTVVLTVADDGVKLPDDFGSPASGGLGLKIVAALTRQLRATIEFRNSDVGKEIVLRVPMDSSDEGSSDA
jgi:two-component sensor histidine kinase